MKTDAHFQQAGHAPEQMRFALGRLGDLTDQFQQRRFSGAVAADHAEDFAGGEIEAHLAQRPEFAWIASARAARRAEPRGHPIAQRLHAEGVRPDEIALAQSARRDQRLRHRSDDIGEDALGVAEVHRAASQHDRRDRHR